MLDPNKIDIEVADKTGINDSNAPVINTNSAKSYFQVNHVSWIMCKLYIR